MIPPNSEVDTADLEDGARTADVAPQGLHAKVLAIEAPRRTVWWFGSGNLTDPVRNSSSVEAMVRLEGKTSKVGIQKFLEAGFESLLVPYEHAPAPPDPQEGSRSGVESFKDVLVRAPLRLVCEPMDGAWLLTLTGAPATADPSPARATPSPCPRRATCASTSRSFASKG